jgi:hypothetical protein
MSYSPGSGPYNNPQVTISSPLQPPPQQLTTAYPNPTIFGGIDGINQTFTWQVWFPVVQVWLNGNLQAPGVDYAAGNTALVFLSPVTPQPGDVITLQGFGTV